MAKQNVKQDTEVAEQSFVGVQPEESEKSTDASTTTENAAEVAETDRVQSERSEGEEMDDKRDPEMDSGSEKETVGEEGNETVDPVAKKRKELADIVFLRHLNCKALYFTSDLIPFFEKSDAFRHTGTLKDNTVVTVNRE